MRTFGAYRFHRLRPWQVWLGGILSGATLLAVLFLASVVALAGIGLALFLAGCGVLVTALRRLMGGRSASPAAVPQVRYAAIPVREVRRVEVEVLDGYGQRRW